MKLLKNKLAVTIIVLSVTFLGLIAYTVKKENRSIIESGAGSALNPIQSLLYKATNQVKETLDFFLNFSEVKSENKKLTEENERFREMLNFAKERDNYNYIGCDIIGYSGGNFNDGYIVNKGSNDSIAKGMVVVTNKGLVGQVTSVGTNWSIIQTLANENIAVSVMVESTREATGYVTGYTDNQNRKLAKVYDLPMDSEVKEGDVIITSGVGMVYPKEIRIGEVISVEEDKVKVMKSAIIKPYVDFNRLEELFIVSPKDTREVKYD